METVREFSLKVDMELFGSEDHVNRAVAVVERELKVKFGSVIVGVRRVS